MSSDRRTLFSLTLAALLAACGGGGGDEVAPPPAPSPPPPPPAPFELPSFGNNPVAQWHQIGAAVITSPALAVGTEEERRPMFAVDMATLQVAIYDAVVSVSGSHEPLIAGLRAEPGLPQEPAVHAAAYTVLSGLFPNRAAQYEPAYQAALAALPVGTPTDRALSVGREVARQVLARRANDGRWTPLPAYAPGNRPGEFRGLNPVNRTYPFIRPFSVRSNAQFRAADPPPLGSAEYAADLKEVQDYGAMNSSLRNAEQLEAARFQTMAPPLFSTSNLQQFATSHETLAGNARAMAMLYVAHADALNTCFESKYHFNRWRPNSAIHLADTDDNAATLPDPGWEPVVSTPNHPEYPSAHSCAWSSAAEIIQNLFGRRQVKFSFTSSVTKTSKTYVTVDDLITHAGDARIHGGMHFRHALVAGRSLGTEVARWVAQRDFQPRPHVD